LSQWPSRLEFVDQNGDTCESPKCELGAAIDILISICKEIQTKHRNGYAYLKLFSANIPIIVIANQQNSEARPEESDIPIVVIANQHNFEARLGESEFLLDGKFRFDDTEAIGHGVPPEILSLIPGQEIVIGPSIDVWQFGLLMFELICKEKIDIDFLRSRINYDALPANETESCCIFSYKMNNWWSSHRDDFKFFSGRFDLSFQLQRIITKSLNHRIDKRITFEKLQRGLEKLKFSFGKGIVQYSSAKLLTRGSHGAIIDIGNELVAKTFREMSGDSSLSREILALQSGKTAKKRSLITSRLALPIESAFLNHDFTLTFKYLHGHELYYYTEHETKIKSESRISFENFFNIFSQIFQAAYQLKEIGCVHGNLKPANIMICENCSIFVVDYGNLKKNWR
jgi:serine/threonine protein kinase